MSQTPAPAPSSNARRQGVVAFGVLGAALLMLGASFAAVPLYRLFCQATGYGGTPQVAKSAPDLRGERTLTVHLDANIAPGLPWRFEPEASSVKARTGETVWVTGALGRAMLGYEGRKEHLAAFNRPRPLLAEGRALAPHVTAMMDVSDGLLLDCWRMARASGVTIALDSHAVPVADPARREECLRWGDDYELLFTLPAEISPPVPATAIGGTAMRADAPLMLDGAAIASSDGLGYRH